MIAGAFYWAFLFFGGIVVLLSAAGALVQLQDQPLDLRSVVIDVAFGGFGAVIATYCGRALFRDNAGILDARLGPGFHRNHIARSGCLFVILVVGSALLLSGPMVLFQLPSMAGEDQSAFAFGAAISIGVGVLLVTPSGIMLWHRRSRSPDAAPSRLIVGVVGGILTVLVGGALLLAMIFDPRYDAGRAAQLVSGAILGVGAIGTAAFGVALWRRLR